MKTDTNLKLPFKNTFLHSKYTCKNITPFLTFQEQQQQQQQQQNTLTIHVL